MRHRARAGSTEHAQAAQGRLAQGMCRRAGKAAPTSLSTMCVIWGSCHTHVTHRWGSCHTTR